MTTFVLVWVLVVLGNGNRPATFSPAVQDLESCVRLQNAVRYQDTQCVQVWVLR